MFVLVINAGSSSLKYQLFRKESEEVMAKGLCEKIGNADSFHKYEIKDSESEVTVLLKNHHDAIQVVLDTLLDKENGVVGSLDEIVAIGHRVVHGGEYFSQSVVIDDEVVARIEECVPLAPLHNPPSLVGIKACFDLMPGTMQVAVFDTAFHQTIPPKSYMYPLPYEMYEQHRIRKYGFHGTSHRYVAARTGEFLNTPIQQLKIVSCHLGNGCSLTAVDGGNSVDNSMGFTPLDGLMMGTRCGSVDPSIVVYMIEKLGMAPAEAENTMNRKSGLLGVTGLTNDLRDVRAAAEDGNERAILAYEMYSNSVKKFIGQYAFEMGGLDAIVFCGGVGENDVRMRKMILDGLEDLGIVLDDEKNQKFGGEREINADDSKISLLVIPTNEELMIVRDVVSLYDRV